MRLLSTRLVTLGLAHVRLAGCVMFACAGLLACGRKPNSHSVLVGAASSVRAPLEEIAAEYASATGVQVELSFASSSRVAHQIEHGAPFDVFVSAHPDWLEHVGGGDSIATVALNTLVIAVRADDPLMTNAGTVSSKGPLSPLWFDAWKGARWVMGDPAHVPAGKYAQQALASLGWWADVAPNLLTASNASAAARLLSLGEARVCVGYASDFRAASGIVTWPVEARHHDAIVIGALATGSQKSSHTRGHAAGFIDALVNSNTWTQHGFEAPPSSGKAQARTQSRTQARTQAAPAGGHE